MKNINANNADHQKRGGLSVAAISMLLFTPNGETAKMHQKIESKINPQLKMEDSFAILGPFSARQLRRDQVLIHTAMWKRARLAGEK